jgi:hypothetical protein
MPMVFDIYYVFVVRQMEFNMIYGYLSNKAGFLVERQRVLNIDLRVFAQQIGYLLKESRNLTLNMGIYVIK